MSDALNKKHFLTFSNQCKGALVTAIDVTRSEKQDEVRLTYRARARKTGAVFQGEWAVKKGADGAAAAAEKAFFDLAEKSFVVTRHDKA